MKIIFMYLIFQAKSEEVVSLKQTRDELHSKCAEKDEEITKKLSEVEELNLKLKQALTDVKSLEVCEGLMNSDHNVMFGK